MTKQHLKKALVVANDVTATVLAVLLAFGVRFEGANLEERLSLVTPLLAAFLPFAAAVYYFFDLYRPKWRFASLPDVYNIARAATVLALTLLVVDYILVSPRLYGTYIFGKITIALYWLFQMALLGGPRVAFRYYKYARSRSKYAGRARGTDLEAHPATLLAGRGGDVEVVLRAIESGALRKLKPVGILSPSAGDHGHNVRGVPVLGRYADLEAVLQDFKRRGQPIRRIIATPSGLAPDSDPDLLLVTARRFAVPLARFSSLGDGVRNAELAPLEIEDLLLRPTVEIDRERIAEFIRGKRVLVTGGGGSIGAEICTRVVAAGAAELLILDSSEPSLHHITENPSLLTGATAVEGVIADVRDRARIQQVMLDFRPDVVFHAAALKHVPYLEKDWAEGIKTNVFGSANVADAAVAARAAILVMISTDKAIEPVSILGVTKRFAEMYTQARDAELRGGQRPTRLIAVRFGNVLGSVGSVVPKFKAQIARGGPLTVTHPDMVRYFMTIREAAELVLTAASHADKEGRTSEAHGAERASVYVLKMGQPVRIMELAERMIRLAGLEPGRDIEIEVTGSRPGERLHEILFAREEPKAEIGLDGVMAAKPTFADRSKVQRWLDELEVAVSNRDRAAAERVFEEAVPDFSKRKMALVPGPATMAAQAGGVGDLGLTGLTSTPTPLA